MKKLLTALLSMAFATTAGWTEEPPADPAAVLKWLPQHWKGADWSHPANRGYMRATANDGWKARMLAMRKLVSTGKDAVPPLLDALKNGDHSLRIFAAQTLSFLAPHVPKENLLEALKSDGNAAVRLYAADALGMRGGTELSEELKAIQAKDSNRDVKKHLGYALERKGAALDADVARTLIDWAPSTMDTARVGQPAPDFELAALTGERIRLSQFRGKKAVVLVFIYGDT